MKKRINITFCLINIIAIFITLVVSLSIFYNVFKQHIINDLKAYATRLLETGAADNPEKLHDEMDFAGIRVTVIGDTGVVLYDSTVDAGTLENHGDRPEFKEALKEGDSVKLRESETIGSSTYYYALKLDTGNVLRVSREASSIVPLFIRGIVLLIFIFIVLILICMVTSSKLTKRIVRPIEMMAGSIEHIDNIILYEELVPLAKMIKEQHFNIQTNEEELKRENEKLQMITNNMSEGIIFLDRDKHILSLNDSAIKLMALKNRTYVGENILNAVRNNEILQSIELAGNGESNFIELSMNGKKLQIFSNPIMDEGHNIGVVCFILDITEKYLRDKMRREFTANVSHELKTPLTSISGYSELIKLNIARNEDVSKFATKIYNESMRLLSLINDIIKLSELDEGVVKEDFKEINLLETIDECIQTLMSPTKEKNITIKVSGDNANIIGNNSMIYELIFNLADNAIRYNKVNGKVDIKVKETKDTVRLSVKDTGIGIPREYKDRVFERFFRVDKSRSKATGGTGLGLSIVKHIANTHNAAIECESEEQVGTKIDIIFKK